MDAFPPPPPPTAQPLPSALTSDGDALTQLEDSLDLLIKIMAASLSFLTLRASHVPIHPDIPISAKEATRASARLVELDEMQGAIDELVTDLVTKAKHIEAIIATLPDGIRTEQEQVSELAQLDERIRIANADFKLALADAEQLQTELTTLLRSVQQEQQRTRLHLQRALAASPPPDSPPPLATAT
ncbi:hypothetical protein OC834_000512 [Tilletia horrida]|uniref:Mediator of RNA polymerase II transcription subunit 21 n=1 Tax=Tilletia horrida TaxID=155126 RepID=A0AAN6JM50_9BASI|nr:hypothetical protein OC835_003009 [Tilletia horrida]KAK0537684.1 hypothetical protein OC842_001560 [Tilletia horrida]KAK0538268.1 hypothetical protein OC834_000512 [Tilletia horrida]